ncbi:MAG TPA: low molecular weight protein-tyrosine-phosphatase [Fibrobacteraceae bacterium]|nr:low molecular weight protein-tyrosine-phosphatase [Fibrobacteraceae bacterium]
MKALFVCLGNICRSPAAEGVARVLAQGLPEWESLDSAGIGGWHTGDPPHTMMRQVARNAGFPIDDLRARQVCAHDFSSFDWILAMDQQNLEELLHLQERYGGRAQIRLLFENGQEVPDPYYGGLKEFQTSFSLIQDGVERFLRES